MFTYIFTLISVLSSFSLACNISTEMETDNRTVLYSCYENSTLQKFEINERNNYVIVEIISDLIYASNVTIDLNLLKVDMDSNEGDVLTIGPGQYEDLYNYPSLMIVENQSEMKNFLITNSNATVVFFNGGASNSNRSFEIEWTRSGTPVTVIPTPQIPTTPITEADRQAIILCFRQIMTCDEFTKNLTLFRRRLADSANAYIEKKKLEISRRVISENIKAECLIIVKGDEDVTNNRTRQNNFLIVAITDSRNVDLPVFRLEQLREIIEQFNKERHFNYEVRECRTYPNYWWWFWGTGIILLIMIAIYCIFWKCINTGFWDEKDASEMTGIENKGFNTDDEEKGGIKKSDPEKPISNGGFLNSEKATSVLSVVQPPTPIAVRRPEEPTDGNHLSATEGSRDLDSVSVSSEHIYEDIRTNDYQNLMPPVSVKKFSLRPRNDSESSQTEL